MRAARPFTNFVSKAAPPPLNKALLHTSDTIRNELVASFEFYSEVTSAGRDLLKKNGHPSPKAAFPRFQSYLRQALAFYASAETLHYRASPLNFYYSFMNFAKAIIFAHDGSFVDANLKHGISAGPSTGSLRRHFVTIHQNGVFPSFYRSTMTKGIQAGTRVRLAPILGYASDVSHEYQQCQLGPRRVQRCKLAFVHQAGQGVQAGQAHLVIAARKGRKQLQTVLSRSPRFEAVALPLNSCRLLFDIPGEAMSSFSFFESRKTYPATPRPPYKSMVDDMLKHFGPNWAKFPFADDFVFELSAPLNAAKVAMNEVLAIYLAMFYLGSLVRYRPWVLEEMLNTKEAWLIERFVKSAPITFLRHARNLVNDEYVAYALR